MGLQSSTPVKREGKAITYVPSIQSLLVPKNDTEGKRVLVVGAGCAGLGAAWHLHRAGVDVTLYEALGKLGGHANTINVDGVDVDTGFMVYNTLNYPNLCALFEELGVEGEPTTMGFSVSMDKGNFEWCSDSLSGLMATSSNLTNPSFYVMFKDIFVFNKAANELLILPEDHPTRKMTVQEFLTHHNLSDAFRDYYLVPMTAAIWSASAMDMLGFPALTLFTFLNNHLLLQVSAHINWQTPKGRSVQYVSKIEKELQGKFEVNKQITSIKRVQSADGKTIITVVDQHGVAAEFDEVIFACHPDQALKILGESASENEKNWLGKFKYADNDTYVHCDESLMPNSKAAWTSWNYIGTTKGDINEKPVFVTYWINKLQNLSHPRPIFVSLNPHKPPAADKTFSKINYAHPQFSLDSVKAQRGVASIQGEHNTYFCGAWMGYGFHEDGFRSGIEVAMAVSGVPAPWVAKYGQHKMIPAPKMTLMNSKGNSLVSTVTSLATKPLLAAFEIFCQRQVLSFLSKGLEKGKLTINLPDNQSLSFGKEHAEYQNVTLCVYKSSFFVRLALEADLGLAKSYIAGEWEILNTGPYSNGLTSFLQLLIDNMPTGKTKTKGGLDAGELLTAWAGSMLNSLWYKFAMDNSIANSRANIHAHYDLSNELFETFLDQDHMMYSSALFETSIDKSQSAPKMKFHGTLEEAQIRKIDALLQRLEPITPDHHLLDIGFGWGGICIRAAEKYGCKVTGITLSSEQKALAEKRVKVKGLSHLITFELVDYRVFANRSNTKFDRIVSCEMIEAVGHNHLGSFFTCVEKLLATEGIFVMQAITMPDSRYPTYVKSADFCNTIIFPGGCCPSLSALLEAMATNSTLHLENATNTNVHYAETLRQWRVRFNNNLPRVLELGFDDAFIRLWNMYFCYCEAGFENQVINLQILTFSRPGNPNMLPARMVSQQGIGYQHSL